ncbi:hypothetical protein B0H14DRAFT_2585208 [Mycena olivaceomarginata]|nr:hypothetical protein B0H14DRAFT_2585208 [Mycena olivaceomarginata]
MKRTSLRMLCSEVVVVAGAGAEAGVGARVVGKECAHLAPVGPTGLAQVQGVVRLRMVPLSVELQHKVLDLILQLDAQCASNATSNLHLLLITSALQLQTQPPSTCDGFVQAMLRCSDLEASAVVNKFKLMLSYIEAAFSLNGGRQKNRQQNETSYSALAKRDGKEVNNERQDPNLATAGMRLIYLAAASSILRTAICKTDYFDLIEKLGYYLCRPSHLTETFCPPLPSKLTGYFALPALNSCYSTLETSLLVPALPLHVWDFDINESFLAEEVTIQTDLDLTRTPCPVNPENSERWTREQREIAASATVVTSLEDLRTQAAAFHAGGVKQSESYLCIPTEIAEGKVVADRPLEKTMTIRGAGGKLIASVITNIGETLPHLLKIATTVFSAIYPGEIYPVDTTTPHEGFSYCAVHKGIWNRYSEQGTDAPDGVHPFRLIREDVSQANVTPCAPLPSREMKDELEESALIAEFIQLLVPSSRCISADGGAAVVAAV